VGCSTVVAAPAQSVCATIEGVSHEGEQYRLDGVCVTTKNAQMNAVLAEDWQLSIWTDGHYVPVLSVVDELRWVNPGKVQLTFMTLNSDISLDITAGYHPSS